MAVKVHCSPMTTCSRLVLLVLEICKVPYEIVVVDLSVGAHMEPSHKKLHPFAKVPLLEDDGFYVYESRAICKYIVKKYGSGTNLMPADGDFKGYALFEQVWIFNNCSLKTSQLTILRHAQSSKAITFHTQAPLLSKRCIGCKFCIRPKRFHNYFLTTFLLQVLIQNWAPPTKQQSQNQLRASKWL